jgi:hypothetical protein
MPPPLPQPRLTRSASFSGIGGPVGSAARLANVVGLPFALGTLQSFGSDPQSPTSRARQQRIAQQQQEEEKLQRLHAAGPESKRPTAPGGGSGGEGGVGLPERKNKRGREDSGGVGWAVAEEYDDNDDDGEIPEPARDRRSGRVRVKRERKSPDAILREEEEKKRTSYPYLRGTAQPGLERDLFETVSDYLAKNLEFQNLALKWTPVAPNSPPLIRGSTFQDRALERVYKPVMALMMSVWYTVVEGFGGDKKNAWIQRDYIDRAISDPAARKHLVALMWIDGIEEGNMVKVKWPNRESSMKTALGVRRSAVDFWPTWRMR